MLISIFYYFEKSSKRKSELVEFRTQYGLEIRKILKHVSTRWLSLGKCVNRLLTQWPAVLEYFKSESTKDSEKQQKVPKTKSVKSASTAQSTSTGSNKTKKEKSDANQQKWPKSKSVKSTSTAANSTISSTTAKVTPSCSSTSAASSKKEFDVAGFIFKQNTLANINKKTSKPVDSKSPKQSSKTETPAKPNPRKKIEEKAAQRIYSLMTNENARLTCLFLQAVFSKFEILNKALQTSSPFIHKMRRVLLDFLTNLLSSFVKPSYITAHKKNLTQMKYQKLEHQKTDEDLFIGEKAESLINSNQNIDKSMFYESVTAFYTKAVGYAPEKLPFDDELLQHAEFICTDNRESATFSSVKYFVYRFPCLNTCIEEGQMDQLQQQFEVYQCFDIPNSVFSGGAEIDTIWYRMGQLKDYFGVLKFDKLAYVAKAVMVVFHSNVDCK